MYMVMHFISSGQGHKTLLFCMAVNLVTFFIILYFTLHINKNISFFFLFLYHFGHANRFIVKRGVRERNEVCMDDDERSKVAKDAK